MSNASTPVPGPALSFEPTLARAGRPHLRCALVPAINPHVAAAHRHTLRWAVGTGLVDARGSELSRLAGARFAWLAARSYPTVSAEQLELVSDWLTFLFFYDDECDTQRSTDPSYRESLVTAENRLVEIGRGAIPCEADAPLALSLADIRRRAAVLAHDGWLERLGRHIAEYVDGCRWERILRLEGHVPSLATYARLRPLISAVPPCFDIAGMCIAGEDPNVVDDVLVQQLELMANNHICWVNDIYGLDKELAEHTTSNLVVVLARQLGLGWDAALDRAIEMCNDELDAFLGLARQMSTRPRATRSYVRALETWMRGNLDWYSDTRRYAPTSSASGRVERSCRPAGGHSIGRALGPSINPRDALRARPSAR